MAVVIAVRCAIVLVVLAMLLVRIVSVVTISRILLRGVAVALVVRLGLAIIVLLLRRICAVWFRSRSLLKLAVVRSPGRVEIGRLIIGHAARAVEAESESGSESQGEESDRRGRSIRRLYCSKPIVQDGKVGDVAEGGRVV